MTEKEIPDDVSEPTSTAAFDPDWNANLNRDPAALPSSP
jgi:hypothetical protein